MRWVTTALLFFVVSSTAYANGTSGRYYTWIDKDGNVHYSDSIPAEASEEDKAIVNQHGVVVEELEGKKTEAEIAAENERLAQEEAMRQQRRADQALLNTYLTIEEIMLHRDRRVELWQAQARVTELYLKNLERRKKQLLKRAARFAPYNEDPDAQMVDPELMEDINETEATIERHVQNLEDYKVEEQQIRARFDGDIARFKQLKGLE